MSEIIIKNAVKRYGNIEVIKNINLKINDKEFFTLLGPSGCGKTTLLRMIAGFNTIEEGEFYFNDKKINNIDPSKRNIGMVFQNYAVFPNMTVYENVAFGLIEKKIPKDIIDKEVNKILDLMQIKNHANKKPQLLSGGQQQRVALARAIVIKPDVLLMDEPLSNLDAKLRIELRQHIRDIQKEIGITTVYVTHDQEEAMAVSDRIAVMKDGIINHLGTPEEIYHNPKNKFVASFIGNNNFIKANLNEKNVIIDNYSFNVNNIENINDKNVLVSIRPEDIILTDDLNSIQARVIDSTFLGSNIHYRLKTNNNEYIEMIEKSNIKNRLKNNLNINIKFDIDKINIFNLDGTMNLGVKYEN